MLDQSISNETSPLSLRRCLKVLCCALVFLFAPSPPGIAQEQLPALEAERPSAELVPLEQALETRGDLALQDVSIQKALFTIGANWRVNVVVGKEVQGTVSCVYKQATLREVLDAILLANGYSYREVGDSLVVLKAQDVGSANPLFESASIPITHSELKEIVEGARLLISKQGQIIALESARSILVVDFVDRVARIRDFVSQMDAAASRNNGGVPVSTSNRLQVAYFHTQFIPVDNTKEPLAAILSAAGRMGTMPAENRLVVVDYPVNIDMVRKVLEQIDRPQPQVRITALIYDISLQDVEQLGLNWNSTGQGRNLDDDNDPQQAFTFDTTTLAPFTDGAVGGVATIRSLTRNFNLTAVVQLLQNANDARLLANPNVTVMDNQTADMSSIQQIPFQMITQSELGGQLGTTAFKDVGITLHVTPTIAADGSVKMQVEQEFSRVAGFTENDNQPIVDSRIANTTVRVLNGQTLVIGGLRQRSDTGEFNGIPLLKDIKYIGSLFRSRNTTVRESELIVFLMPEIVEYAEPATPREYLAQETINGRLAHIPLAEGCGVTGGAGDDCAWQSAAGGDVPMPLPPVTAHGLPAAPAVSLPQSAWTSGLPFRQEFSERFRSETHQPTSR